MTADIKLLPLPPYIYGREAGDNEKMLTLPRAEDYARAVAEHNVAARDAQIAQLEKANEQLHAHGERMHEQLQKMRAAQQPPAEAVGTVLGGEFHYLRVNHGLPDGTKLYTPPPSAPVGVEGRAREAVALALDERGHHTEADNVRNGIDLDEYRDALSIARAALAQQPAAAGELAELVGLLDEVRSHFTRDDDLPDDLLPRIDAALAGQQGGNTDE